MFSMQADQPLRGLQPVRAGTYSFIGGRKNNEDSAFYALIRATVEGIDSYQGVAVITDGMGGYRRGEVAARLATTRLGSKLAYYAIMGGGEASVVDYREALKLAFTMTNNEILRMASGKPEDEGMGATATAAIVDINNLRVWIGHIGDTRAYALNSNSVMQLTKDHALVQELVDKGAIAPEQARRHPQRNVITRALGMPDTQPDIYEYNLADGSYLLLCTDGLSHEVSEGEMQRMVLGGIRKYRSPTSVVRSLAKLAFSRGENDNITGVLLGPLIRR